MGEFGWDAQTIARHAIPALAAAAVSLIVVIRQRREGGTLHGARTLRASLLHRALGPVALAVGLLIALAMTGARVNGRLAGSILAACFVAGGFYLTYYCLVRRIAWSDDAIALWTPLRKWRRVGFADIAGLSYSSLTHELRVHAPHLVLNVPDSFHGFARLIEDLRRARPDLFGDDGEEEAQTEAPMPALTPALRESP